MILWLTVSGEQLSEVDGEGDPVLTEDRVTVAPQADVHGAGPGLMERTGSDFDRVVLFLPQAVVRTPCPSAVSGGLPLKAPPYFFYVF